MWKENKWGGMLPFAGRTLPNEVRAAMEIRVLDLITDGLGIYEAIDDLARLFNVSDDWASEVASDVYYDAE
jgi:hypothetical protein